MPKKNTTNAAIRQSCERVAAAKVNPATKLVRVADVDAGVVVDFPQTAPHEVAAVITESIPRRAKDVRVTYGHSNLLSIRRDIREFLRDVHSMEFTDHELLEKFRALRDKHEDKWLALPAPDYSEMYWKRFGHIKVSLEQDTEWDRAIKFRYKLIDQDEQSVKEMGEFGKVVIKIAQLNGSPTEFSQI